MLREMLDTDTCIRVLRDRLKSIGDRFKAEADNLCISTIVMHELHHGAIKSARPNVHLEKLEDFVSRLTVCNFDEAAAAHAADIKLDLGRKGNLIGPNDLLIAGHARSLGLKLITGNLKEFTRVDGLRCEDWLNMEKAEK
jgi:tRNA(fMet)-specific endonuclease VapC